MKLRSLILPGLVFAGLFEAALLDAQERELLDESGKVIVRYVAEAPAYVAPAGTTDPAKQVGLFLCFQEHGRPTGDDLFPVRESLKRLGLTQHYVLIAAHSQDPKGKMGAADHEPILKLIAWAEKTYPINPRRIYAYGKGEGGKISGELGVLHPNVVTAGITYSWGWWTMPSELTEALDPEKSAQFYMVLGLRDLSHHLTTVRDTYERVNAKGYHVIYREFSELGDRTYHPVSNDDAIRWATRLRNANLPLSSGEKKLLESFVPTLSDSFDYYPALSLVGGAPAGVLVRKLFSSADPSVRLAAATTCSHAIFDETTTVALGRLLKDSAVDVQRAAERALAMYANWRSEAAQHALIEIATDSSAKLDDRVAAADGIAQAMAFQAVGVRQDPPMFRALVSLLGEKEENLRAIARLALAPVRDPNYRPGTAPESKSPAGGWENWLHEITVKQAGDAAAYEICGWSGSSGKPLSGEAELFCKGGVALKGRDPAGAFRLTLQAAEGGYIPAEEAVGMLYANGKGVEQNYAEAGKWWIKAAEGGNLRAAENAAMLYRNGEGVPHNREIADKWAKYVADHTQPSEPSVHAAKVMLTPNGSTVGAPFSPGLIVNDFIYVSGQGPAGSGKTASDFEGQTRQTFENIRRVLEGAGLTMQHVVYAQVYLSDMSHYDQLNRIWAEAFPQAPPARAVLGVYKLVGDAQLEVTAVAFKDLSRRSVLVPPGYPAGPASPGVIAGEKVYLSGFLGVDDSGKIPTQPEAQVEAAFAQMKQTLALAGLDFRHLVFVNPYQTDQVKGVMNKVYAGHFESGDTPARATITANSLPLGANIELTGVAVRDISKRRAVRPKNMAPSPTASPCVWGDDTYYCSAKSAFIPGPSHDIYASTTETQVRMTMRNLLDGLEEAGLTFANVIATNVYLDDLKDFSGMNRIYVQYFPDVRPTRTTVAQVAPLPDRGPVKTDVYPTLEQISVIAVR
jgi:enamine deaminase RidA (YjgF/YER057c/UK114 family)/TPR repeat protein